jgi:uncharacterized OB-fold protein
MYEAKGGLVTDSRPRLAVDSLAVLTADGPRLRGSQCSVCSTINFPAVPFCSNPDCAPDRTLVHDWLGGPTGTLWSWSIQCVRAPAPFRYEVDGPYAVGMVDLPENVRVLGLLTQSGGLQHEMPMRLELAPLYTDVGEPVYTWMWAPDA